MRLKFKGNKNSKNEGFTLIEVLVAILVGGTVLTIAIVALVATNSSSMKILAKDEAQANTRRAMSLIFSEIGDAESLPVCRVVDSSVNGAFEKQRRIAGELSSGYPHNPTNLGGFVSSDCGEIASSPYLVAYASNNRLCYFKTPLATNYDDNSLNASIKCVSRGGADFTSGQISQPTNPVRATGPCVNLNLASRPFQNLYTWECQGNGGGGLLVWPQSYAVPSTPTLLVELGEIPIAEQTPAFNYFGVSNVNEIVRVDVELKAGYDSKIGGATENEVYTFSQLILLKGSEQYREESRVDY